MTQEEKRKKLLEMTDKDRMEPKMPEDLEEFKALVSEGMEKGWPEALEIMAYASYGGNEIYPENWELSRDCLLKLIDLSASPSPFYYNTLGYIYYYGRCNGGIPEYEKAFQYFSVGAWNGVYESQYKLSDLFLSGKGVPKNMEAAVNLVSKMYDDCEDSLRSGNFSGKLADVALRLGGFYEKGIGTEKRPEVALYMYLVADYAIGLRMEEGEFYGDRKVQSRIQEALKRAKESMPPDYFKDRLETRGPVLIGNLLKSSSGIDVCFFEKEGQVFLLAKMLSPVILDQCETEKEPGENTGEPEENKYNEALAERPEELTSEKQYLMVIPEMCLCTLTDQVIMRVEDLENLESADRELHAFVNHIEYVEEEKTWYFCYLEQPVFKLKCRAFSFEK